MIISTFNMRLDVLSDGPNRLTHRKKIILKAIQESAADIIGFQELETDTLSWLKANLPSYTFLGCGREANLLGESTAIAICKNRFQIIATDTFWLSDTPRIPGSKFPNQNFYPRNCTTALLYDIDSASVIRVYNTHLDHESVEARLNGVKLIAKTAKAENLLADVPFIITGDFNAEPGAKEIKGLMDTLNLQDLTASIPGTFHDFGRLNPAPKIDYIFASRIFKLEQAYLWPENDLELYISDHHPISVKVSL